VTTPAYTLGATRSYDQALAEEPTTMKIGFRPDSPEWPGGYEGGWVWPTAEAARAYWDEHQGEILDTYTAKSFSVYEIQLPGSWESSVSAEPAPDGVHRLLVDARIIRKVTSPLDNHE